MLTLFKKYKFIILAVAVAIVVLAVAFFSGGSLNNQTAVKTQSTTINTTATEITQSATTQPSTKKAEIKGTEVPNTTIGSVPKTEPTTGVVASDKKNNTNKKNNTTATTRPVGKDEYKTDLDAIPEDKPLPVEPEDQEIEDTTLKCTFSISCATILDNMSDLAEEKIDLVPKDGWIVKPVTVTFNEGESVFDVLKKFCMDNKIHMEYSFTPIFNSAYIEGIGNLYEFDCGSMSGWMYKVNDWFPNYGVSRYQLQNGDNVSILYTCNLGYDIGSGLEMGESNE